MSFTKVLVYGNLTRDPELRFTPSGSEVCNLSLAVNRKWKNSAGEPQEEVSYLDAVAFGKTADVVSKYFHKGDQIILDGRLKQERWEDKNDGGKRSRVVIQVDRVEFVGGRKSAESAPAGTPGDDGGGEDVPF